MLSRHVIAEAADLPFLGVLQPTHAVFRRVSVDEWPVLIRHQQSLIRLAAAPWLLQVAQSLHCCGCGLITCQLNVAVPAWLSTAWQQNWIDGCRPFLPNRELILEMYRQGMESTSEQRPLPQSANCSPRALLLSIGWSLTSRSYANNQKPLVRAEHCVDKSCLSRS